MELKINGKMIISFIAYMVVFVILSERIGDINTLLIMLLFSSMIWVGFRVFASKKDEFEVEIIKLHKELHKRKK